MIEIKNNQKEILDNNVIEIKNNQKEILDNNLTEIKNNNNKEKTIMDQENFNKLYEKLNIRKYYDEIDNIKNKNNNQKNLYKSPLNNKVNQKIIKIVNNNINIKNNHEKIKYINIHKKENNINVLDNYNINSNSPNKIIGKVNNNINNHSPNKLMRKAIGSINKKNHNKQIGKVSANIDNNFLYFNKIDKSNERKNRYIRNINDNNLLYSHLYFNRNNLDKNNITISPNQQRNKITLINASRNKNYNRKVEFKSAENHFQKMRKKIPYKCNKRLLSNKSQESLGKNNYKKIQFNGNNLKINNDLNKTNLMNFNENKKITLYKKSSNFENKNLKTIKLGQKEK